MDENINFNIPDNDVKKSLIVTGHQPAYLPWLGYFHKAVLGDIFIYMDDVQFIERGYIHRNQVKTSGGPVWLTIPLDLKKSKSRIIKDILILNDVTSTDKNWSVKHWKTICLSYGKAPYFNQHKQFFAHVYLEKRWDYLSDLCLVIFNYLLKAFKITADVKIASTLGFTKNKSDLVLEHCQRFNATHCVTGKMGENYIDENTFKKNNIVVYHQNYMHPKYQQRFGEFSSNMAAIDLLFNHGDASLEIMQIDNVAKNDIYGLKL